MLPSEPSGKPIETGIANDIAKEPELQENQLHTETGKQEIQQQKDTDSQKVIPVQPIHWQQPFREVTNDKNQNRLPEKSLELPNAAEKSSTERDESKQKSEEEIFPVKIEVRDSPSSHKIEIIEPKKNIQLSYFSKHIERLNTNEKNSPVIDEPLQQNIQDSIHFESNENVSSSAKKVISKMIPDKEDNETQELNKKSESAEQKIDNLSPEVEQQKKISPVINSYELTRITPSQPILEKSVPLNNKSKQEKPRLVIGKIIVEVLPPEKQAPPRVVTKVVQQSSDNNNSKINKLSFGLGQL